MLVCRSGSHIGLGGLAGVLSAGVARRPPPVRPPALPLGSSPCVGNVLRCVLCGGARVVLKLKLKILPFINTNRWRLTYQWRGANPS